jgi:NTP pyrophosphatase (non-canonical NTP hydrolase)
MENPPNQLHIELYKKALKYWGLEAQMIMLFEETAELQQAISKIWRGKADKSDIASEMADVEIMIEQMCVAFDIDRKLINFKKEQKLERLGQMVSKCEN